jgi:hypothetical protein
MTAPEQDGNVALAVGVAVDEGGAGSTRRSSNVDDEEVMSLLAVTPPRARYPTVMVPCIQA